MSRGQVLFVAGVSGSGKTAVGQALAHHLGADFLEGDDYHPPENVAAMRAGHALNDAMRWPWLKTLAAAANARGQSGRDVVVSCSALRRSYRDLLRQEAGPCRMILLTGTPEQIRDRMARRRNHYMPPSLLDSQLATLELPQADEKDIIEVENTAPLDAVVARVEKLLKTGF